MKKLACLVLALFMFLIPAPELIGIDNAGMSATVYAAKNSNIEDTLIKGFQYCSPKIEFVKKISNYTDGMENDFYNEIFAVHDKLLLDKRFFYVEDQAEFRDGYIQNNEMHVFLYKSYVCSKKQLKTYQDKFNKNLKQMVSGVDKNWTDIQKVAYLHDQLVLNTTYLLDESSRRTSTPYSCLVEKKALCEGYARTYSILLSEVGIESKHVGGTGTNDAGSEPHAWNLVKLDKKWYHVDCTFDDPTINGQEYPYYVSHEYFLKSDSGLTGHTDYSPSGLAKSTKYDKKDWAGFSAFAFNKKSIIYASETAVKEFNTSTGKTTNLFSVKDTWKVEPTYTRGGVSMDGTYSQIVPSDNAIYYNLAHGVYKYSLKTGKKETVYSNKNTDSMITGLYIKKGKLYATFCDYEGNESDKAIKTLK